MLASVVIRTLDEQRHLPALLEMIACQETRDVDVEVLVVDSGSRDRTRAIAERHGCRIVSIEREHFSFGRSLNLGCGASAGELLVFVSGHCVPLDSLWLQHLIDPLLDGVVVYSYGRQLGGTGSRFSESRLFRKQYPEASRIPQEGYFCNNANAALLRSVWEKHPFDEESTGLEDMALAKELVRHGLRIGYVAEARVAHHHHESWNQVRWRFEREALALRHIMPQVHIGPLDFLRYFVSAVLLDAGAALQGEQLLAALPEIVRFRLAQYWGSYRGNHEHRRLSRRQREHYFFPKGR